MRSYPFVLSKASFLLRCGSLAAFLASGALVGACGAATADADVTAASADTLADTAIADVTEVDDSMLDTLLSDTVGAGDTGDSSGSGDTSGSGDSTGGGASDVDPPDAAPAQDDSDPTFGLNGVATLQPTAFKFTPRHGVVLADGRIQLIGVGNDEVGKVNLVVGNLTANGAPDLLPGGNASLKFGYAGSPYNLETVRVVERVAGSLFYYGHATAGGGTGHYGWLESHLADYAGTCDAFGPTAAFCAQVPASTTPSMAPAGISAVAFAADGSIYVGGGGPSDQVGVNSNFVLHKLTASGAVIDAFGPTGYGMATVDLGGQDAVTLLAIQGDGKILAVGGSIGGATPGVAMARFSSAGALDASFGAGGKVNLGVPSEQLVLLPEGKILGAFHGLASGSFTTLVRFLPTGSVDTSFGSSGYANAPWPAGATAVTALANGSGGTILVGYDNFTVGRMTSSGAMDVSWHGDGFATVGAPKVPATAQLTAVGEQASGKVVAMGGQSKNGNEDKYFYAVRF